jgi:hypothetical protein
MNGMKVIRIGAGVRRKSDGATGIVRNMYADENGAAWIFVTGGTGELERVTVTLSGEPSIHYELLS